jgi:hypothetical protein
MTQFIRILCGEVYASELQVYSLKQEYYATVYNLPKRATHSCSWVNCDRGFYLQTLRGSEGRLIVASER